MNEKLVQMQYVSVAFERPPMSLLYFHVSLYNPYTEARWFLLPDEQPSLQNQPYTIYVAEVYALSGQGWVIVGHFRGSHGCYAIYLPAGGQVRLENFPIRFLDEYLPRFDLEITYAHEMTIGGEPPRAWFGMKTLSDAPALVSAEALADQREVIFVRQMPDFREVEIIPIKGERIRLEIDTTI